MVDDINPNVGTVIINKATPTVNLDNLLQNLEDGVDEELKAIIARLQLMLQQAQPEKADLMQAEQRLISLSQISLIVKALNLLLLPSGNFERQQRHQALLQEITKLEDEVKDSINRNQISQVEQTFQKQLLEAEQKVLQQEKDMKEMIVKREQEIARSIQRTLKLVTK